VVQLALHKEMTEENSTNLHLSVAMTTKEVDEVNETQTIGGNTTTPSSYWYYWNTGIYVEVCVIIIAVVGMAGNGLIIYALVASKQHKKHALIVNQNVLDLCSSFFMAILYAVQLGKFTLTGELGYWLCMLLFSENLIWSATNGSMVNLAIITIDRYLKVVYAVWSRKWLRPWVVRSAMVFPWLAGFAYNTTIVFLSSAVINGRCHSYELLGYVDNIISISFYVSFFYFIILAIFIFCYGRILVKIRKQARVMASHNATGPSTAQNQSNQIQSNVIKTMIFVSAFYAIAWLPYTLYIFIFGTMIIPGLSFFDDAFHAVTFIAFFYTAANPFIYATKFDPVRKVLKKLIPCKRTTVQPSTGA